MGLGSLWPEDWPSGPMNDPTGWLAKRSGSTARALESIAIDPMDVRRSIHALGS